jgi:alpha-glucosidase
MSRLKQLSSVHAALIRQEHQDRFDGIKSAVTGLLSSGLSGFAFNHSDIGGYTAVTSPIRNYHRSKELLMRWMEPSAFTVVYRTHEGNQPENNVQFYTDEETMVQFDRMARVYRAWAPYRKELVAEAAETGLPVVRHLFIHYPDDPNVYGISYEEFLVGSEFLVAPVLEPGREEEVEVYLPQGRWVHLWTGEVYGSADGSGGVTVTVPAPIGRPAVFYLEGSAAGQELARNLEAEGLLGQ